MLNFFLPLGNMKDGAPSWDGGHNSDPVHKIITKFGKHVEESQHEFPSEFSMSSMLRGCSTTSQISSVCEELIYLTLESS